MTASLEDHVIDCVITASIVFSSMTAFEMMRNQMFRVMYMVPALINANVSLTRVADFLQNVGLRAYIQITELT